LLVSEQTQAGRRKKGEKEGKTKERIEGKEK
jgi:hypothetical protein